MNSITSDIFTRVSFRVCKIIQKRVWNKLDTRIREDVCDNNFFKIAEVHHYPTFINQFSPNMRTMLRLHIFSIIEELNND
jgi:hypothetical protein